MLVRLRDKPQPEEREKTMYQVWKINDRGIYEKEAEVDNAILAGAIKRALIKRGVFAQVCKAGEMSINGGER